MLRKNNSKPLRSSTRRRPLGIETLEERRVLTVFINELMLDPLFGDIRTDQYVEIRNDNSGAIPSDTYLVFVEGDEFEQGKIHTIFDLSDLPTGSNGILTLFQKDHPYDLSAGGHALVSTAEEFGGLPPGVYQGDTQIADRIDFIVRSNTVFLIQSPTAPTLFTDIDSNDDGVANAIPADWTILDHISLVGHDGVAYSDLVFRSDNLGPVSANPGDIVIDGDNNYAARIGDSTGQTPGDWVVGSAQQYDVGSQRIFRFTEFFGTPSPASFTDADIDHVGRRNDQGFFGQGSGTNVTNVPRGVVSAGTTSNTGTDEPLGPGPVDEYLLSSLDDEITLVENGGSVQITGTNLPDQIHVTAGLTEHVVEINGDTYRYDATTINKIDIQALGGVDVVTLVGTSLDDQADLLATHGKLVSSAYEITVAGAETISAYGGNGGLDKAVLADSLGNDVFLGSASFASMRDINNAYRNEARGFDIITGNSVLGGVDQAVVFGTHGTDQVKVFPEFARMTRGAGNTEFRANRFEHFEARGEGGDDFAEYVDSDGDDHLTLEFHQAEMVGSGYQNKVTNFDTIHARASRGGTDSATFYDSAGDDELAIRPAKAMYMQGPDFENRIWGFDRTEAFADAGGFDISFLYDTGGDDVFIADPTTSTMRGEIAGETYEHVTHNFETMTGHAMYAGFDAAFVYDSAGDETLISRPDFLEVQGANDSFKHRLLDFQTVVAYGNEGGNDTATFLDTYVFSNTVSDDVFKSTPTRASMEQPGTLFRKTVEGYETVGAVATDGNDIAEFYDVSANETLTGGGNIANIAARGTNVNGFDRVQATSLGGDTATANLDAVNFIFDQFGQWNDI